MYRLYSFLLKRVNEYYYELIYIDALGQSDNVALWVSIMDATEVLMLEQ